MIGELQALNIDSGLKFTVSVSAYLTCLFHSFNQAENKTKILNDMNIIIILVYFSAFSPHVILATLVA